MSISSLNQTEFESLRNALLNSYNSQVTNHVTAVVALIVGIFILISTKEFRKLYNKHRKWFLFALSLPISLIEYLVEKMLFWAWMSSEVLTVTENQALRLHESTVIFGIQAYLTNYLENNVHTISSTLWQLDQRQFGTSFVLLFAATYVIFGFCYEYYMSKSFEHFFDAAKNYKWDFYGSKSYKWHKKWCKLVGWYLIALGNGFGKSIDAFLDKKYVKIDILIGLFVVIGISACFYSLISTWIFFEFQWLFIWIFGLFIWLLSEFYSGF